MKNKDLKKQRFEKIKVWKIYQYQKNNDEKINV